MRIGTALKVSWNQMWKSVGTWWPAALLVVLTGGLGFEGWFLANALADLGTMAIIGVPLLLATLSSTWILFAAFNAWRGGGLSWLQPNRIRWIAYGIYAGLNAVTGTLLYLSFSATTTGSATQIIPALLVTGSSLIVAVLGFIAMYAVLHALGHGAYAGWSTSLRTYLVPGLIVILGGALLGTLLQLPGLRLVSPLTSALLGVYAAMTFAAIVLDVEVDETTSAPNVRAGTPET